MPSLLAGGSPGPGCTTTSQTGPRSAKVAPVGCQLATMALKTKTVIVPKGGLHGRSCHPIWDVSVSGLSFTDETGGLSATLAVNRLGRCRATQPMTKII